MCQCPVGVVAGCQIRTLGLFNVCQPSIVQGRIKSSIAEIIYCGCFSRASVTVLPHLIPYAKIVAYYVPATNKIKEEMLYEN